jgi:hypothetical protein
MNNDLALATKISEIVCFTYTRRGPNIRFNNPQVANDCPGHKEGED